VERYRDAVPESFAASTSTFLIPTTTVPRIESSSHPLLSVGTYRTVEANGATFSPSKRAPSYILAAIGTFCLQSIGHRVVVFDPCGHHQPHPLKKWRTPTDNCVIMNERMNSLYQRLYFLSLLTTFTTSCWLLDLETRNPVQL